MNVSEWWDLQESSRKRMIVIAGALGALLLLLWMIPTKDRGARPEPVVAPRVELLGDDGGQADLQTALSQLRAVQDQVNQMRRTNDAQQRRIQQLQNALSAATSITANPEQLAGLVDEVNRLRQDLQEVRESGVGSRRDSDAPPVVVLGSEEEETERQPRARRDQPPIADPFSNAGGGGRDALTSYDPLERIRGAINDRGQSTDRARGASGPFSRDARLDRPPPRIVIDEPEGAQQVSARTAGSRPNQTARDRRGELAAGDVPQEIYLPSGTMFEAILMNGMDAPTGGGAARSPYPVAMRISSVAFLPNRFQTNVRECFLGGSGFGRLDSERVHIRTETLSCILNDGSVVDADVEGYITGEDGKVGMRGIVVERSGALLARAALAGIASGLSEATRPRIRSSVQTGAGAGGISFDTPDTRDVLEVGAYAGVSSAMEKLADFYLERAEEIYPIIELDAMRQATAHLTRGVHLRIMSDARHGEQLAGGNRG